MARVMNFHKKEPSIPGERDIPLKSDLYPVHKIRRARLGINRLVRVCSDAGVSVDPSALPSDYSLRAAELNMLVTCIKEMSPEQIIRYAGAIARIAKG